MKNFLIIFLLFFALPLCAERVNLDKPFYNRFADTNYFIYGSDDPDFKPNSRFFISGDLYLQDSLYVKNKILSLDNLSSIDLSQGILSINSQALLSLDQRIFKLNSRQNFLGSKIRVADNLSLSTDLDDESLNIGGSISLFENDSSFGLSANYGKIFAKKDGKIYYINSRGDQYDLTQLGNSEALWDNKNSYLTPKNNLGLLIGSNQVEDSNFLIKQDGSIFFNLGAKANQFRISGKNDTSLFVVNSANNNIGIGINKPEHKLHVLGDISANYFIGDASKLTNLSANQISGIIQDSINSINLIGGGSIINTGIQASNIHDSNFANSRIDSSVLSNDNFASVNLSNNNFANNNSFDINSKILLEGNLQIPINAKQSSILVSDYLGNAFWQEARLLLPTNDYVQSRYWAKRQDTPRWIFPQDTSYGFMSGSPSELLSDFVLSASSAIFRKGLFVNDTIFQANNDSIIIGNLSYPDDSLRSRAKLTVLGDIATSNHLIGDGTYIRNIDGKEVRGIVAEALHALQSQDSAKADFANHSVNSSNTQNIEDGLVSETSVQGALIEGSKIINPSFDDLLISKLVSSDGSPNPAASVDNNGNFGIATNLPSGTLDISGATKGWQSPSEYTIPHQLEGFALVDGLNDLLLAGDLETNNNLVTGRILAGYLKGDAANLEIDRIVSVGSSDYSSQSRIIKNGIITKSIFDGQNDPISKVTKDAFLVRVNAERSGIALSSMHKPNLTPTKGFANPSLYISSPNSSEYSMNIVDPNTNQAAIIVEANNLTVKGDIQAGISVYAAKMVGNSFVGCLGFKNAGGFIQPICNKNDLVMFILRGGR